MRNSIAAFVFLALAITACGPSYFYQSDTAIPAGGWMYRDTLDFGFTVADTSALYNLYLDTEYADSFPNQNLYLKLYTRFPDGKRLAKPYAFDLFDALGAAKGKCSGHTCTLRTLLQQNAFFNQTGPYTITVEQFMRRDSITGIRSVGLTVEKTAGKK